MALRLVGYVRVSSQEQGRSGLGLEAQQEAIRAACQTRGWQLLRIEQDVTSGKQLAGRDALDRALIACREGHADGVISARIDRLSRSVVDFGLLLEDAQAHNFNLVALDLGVDLSTSAGRMVAHVLSAVAEWERETIVQRTRDAIAAKKARGETLGRPKFYGPRLLDRIRAMHADGRTYKSIAAELNSQREPTSTGRPWHPRSVQRLAETA